MKTFLPLVLLAAALGLAGSQSDAADAELLKKCTICHGDKGVSDGTTLAALVAKKERDYTFAQTFPTGTHAMWLYYWLATYGINLIDKDYARRMALGLGEEVLGGQQRLDFRKNVAVFRFHRSTS